MKGVPPSTIAQLTKYNNNLLEKTEILLFVMNVKKKDLKMWLFFPK